MTRSTDSLIAEAVAQLHSVERAYNDVIERLEADLVEADDAGKHGWSLVNSLSIAADPLIHELEHPRMRAIIAKYDEEEPTANLGAKVAALADALGAVPTPE